MRDKEEILKKAESGLGMDSIYLAILEVLIDIRDLAKGKGKDEQQG